MLTPYSLVATVGGKRREVEGANGMRPCQLSNGKKTRKQERKKERNRDACDPTTNILDPNQNVDGEHSMCDVHFQSTT
jgi:hypothetical protein